MNNKNNSTFYIVTLGCMMILIGFLVFVVGIQTRKVYNELVATNLEIKAQIAAEKQNTAMALKILSRQNWYVNEYGSLTESLKMPYGEVISAGNWLEEFKPNSDSLQDKEKARSARWGYLMSISGKKVVFGPVSEIDPKQSFTICGGLLWFKVVDS